MKIKFENWHSKFIQLTPDISFGWHGDYVLYIGWLFWSVTFEFKKSKS